MRKSSTVIKATLIAIATFVISASVFSFVAPAKVSGPGMEGVDCGPTALCGRGANPHIQWLIGYELLIGTTEVGSPSTSDDYVQKVEKEDLEQSLLITTLLSIVPAIGVFAIIVRRRSNVQQS